MYENVRDPLNNLLDNASQHVNKSFGVEDKQVKGADDSAPSQPSNTGVPTDEEIENMSPEELKAFLGG